MMSPPARGVYFLANNHVIELAIAFLNSFRTHNPDIPLCLIPFDDKVDKILALQNTYSFQVYDNQELLRACDEISARFHGNVCGAYRKLVAWDGPFEEFVYIDTDTVVVQPIDFVFENFEFADIFTSHSNIPKIRKWVWKDSIDGSTVLSREQISFAANTGFFVSKSKLLSMEYIRTRIDAALELKEHMELHCMEQPLLNYLIVTSGYRYGSLLEFRKAKTGRRLQHEWWAGTPGGYVRKGKFRLLFGPKIFLVHWAGVWQKDGGTLAEIPYKRLWDYYRHLDFKSLKAA